jgi:hypothetical protein
MKDALYAELSSFTRCLIDNMLTGGGLGDVDRSIIFIHPAEADIEVCIKTDSGHVVLGHIEY